MGVELPPAATNQRLLVLLHCSAAIPALLACWHATQTVAAASAPPRPASLSASIPALSALQLQVTAKTPERHLQSVLLD